MICTYESIQLHKGLQYYINWNILENGSANGQDQDGGLWVGMYWGDQVTNINKLA